MKRITPETKRCKSFISWWKEISPKAHLYPPEILGHTIDEKIKELEKEE